jgi:hypothetical protein
MRLVLLAAALLLAACSGAPDTLYSHEGPLYFTVELAGKVPGVEAEEPAPFSVEGAPVPLRIQAMGYDKEPLAWDGAVRLRVKPGVLREITQNGQGRGDGLVEIRGGTAEVTATIALGYDQVRLWVSDEGDGGDDATFASGAAPLLHVLRPTIAELQRPIEAGGDSPLDRMYVPLRGWADEFEPRDVVVTAVLNDGFYVLDKSEPGGEYAGLFVFTFSRPDGVEVGTRIAELSGIVDEFIGFTELAFPDWKVDSSGHDPGPPLVLRPEWVCDDLEMEKHEARVVELTTPTPDFRRASDCGDFTDFGQWPAVIPGECDGQDARVSVVNINTVPSFDFPECEENRRPEPPEDGEPADPRFELEYLRGVLRHTEPADPSWIIDVRNCLDLPAAARPDDCPQLLMRPASGPRKAPHFYYRDIVTCDGVPYRLDQ